MRYLKAKTVSLLVTALLVPGLVMAASTPTVRQAGQLLQALPSDQVPDRLMPGELAPIKVDHAPVQISWALNAGETLSAQPQAFERLSREYQIDATGPELERGIDLPLSAPGALLRISPRDKNTAPLNAGQVFITAHGQRLNAAHASTALVSAEAMAQSGMAMQAGSLAMRLNSDIGSENLQLAASGTRGNYLVQVTEPDSPYALSLKADRDTRLAGQTVQIQARLQQAARGSARLTAISGVLEAPDGWSTDIDFSPQPDHGWIATVTPPATHAGQRGLWQVHVFASGANGKQELLRDATNAFAAVRPTARLTGTLVQQPGKAGQDLVFDVGVEAASASRYAISAVLHGHDANGTLRPAVFAQSANWLEPGSQHALSLRFDATAIAKSGLKGPFELHDLRLEDQVQIGLLERRQLAAQGLAAQP